MSMDQGPSSPTSPPQRPSLASRPRSRGISFRSDKSGGSENRLKYVESPREKAQRDKIWKGTSKANPNAAINEAQPGVANVIEQSTLQNIREIEHRDAEGNVIVDKDNANPTRRRMERPLDTIRGFEKAIDDGYKRRQSYVRQDSEQWDKQNQFASRPSSYFGGEYTPSNKRQSLANPRSGQGNGNGNINHQNFNRYGGGYYGNQSQRQDFGVPNGQRARYGNNRMQQDPYANGNGHQRAPYAQHAYHDSHDTVNTGMTNGSDSTGPWQTSTNPSSESSSIERNGKPGTPHDGYNGNYNNGPIAEEHSEYSNNYGQYWDRSQQPRQNGYGAVQAPQQQPQSEYSGYHSAQQDPRRQQQQYGLGQGYGQTPQQQQAQEAEFARTAKLQRKPTNDKSNSKSKWYKRLSRKNSD